jgi:hypothetical protein
VPSAYAGHINQPESLTCLLPCGVVGLEYCQVAGILHLFVICPTTIERRFGPAVWTLADDVFVLEAA